MTDVIETGSDAIGTVSDVIIRDKNLCHRDKE